MYGTVVVGHDGTPAADAALRLAEQLAGDDALLVLARVVRADRPGEAESELERLRAGVTRARRVETRVVTAHSAERGLVALAKEVAADLIVVGSDRRPQDYRAHNVLGLRLLRGAPGAVAIASSRAEPEIRHIGVAYDGSADAELALTAAYELAQRWRAAVTLYLALPPEVTEDLRAQLVYREACALLDAAADRAPEGVNPETVIVRGYASLALAERAEGVVDLLVVGSRPRGPIRQALLGSTSRALAVELDCAVLVTPRRSAAAPGPRATTMDDRGALRGEVQ